MNQKIQPIAGTALWRHITDKLDKAIDAKILKPGDPLPSEHELMSEYGVSRNTVRRALGRLRELGKIEMSQGKGTFVRREPLLYTITLRTRFASDITDDGFNLDVQFVAHREMKADPGLAQALQLDVGAPITYLKAVTSVDGVPVSYGRIFHPAQRFPGIGIKRKENPDIAAVYREYGIQDFVRRITWINAKTPSEDEAQILAQDTLDPVMVSRKIDDDENGKPIEFNETVWSARRIQFTMPADANSHPDDAILRSITLPD